MCCSNTVMLGVSFTRWTKHFLHGCTCGVGHVDDAALRVAAFAGQMHVAVFLGKHHAAIAQPVHGFGRVLRRRTWWHPNRTGPRRPPRCLPHGDLMVSPSPSTAAMPPCAQALEPSPSTFLVITATRCVGAKCSAADKPAKPLPMMMTSNCLVINGIKLRWWMTLVIISVRWMFMSECRSASHK